MREGRIRAIEGALLIAWGAADGFLSMELYHHLPFDAWSVLAAVCLSFVCLLGAGGIWAIGHLMRIRLVAIEGEERMSNLVDDLIKMADEPE